MKKLDQDPVVFESAQKKYRFSHSKVSNETVEQKGLKTIQ